MDYMCAWPPGHVSACHDWLKTCWKHGHCAACLKQEDERPMAALAAQLAHQFPFSLQAPVALAHAYYCQHMASSDAPSTQQERSLIIQVLLPSGLILTCRVLNQCALRVGQPGISVPSTFSSGLTTV